MLVPCSLDLVMKGVTGRFKSLTEELRKGKVLALEYCCERQLICV